MIIKRTAYQLGVAVDDLRDALAREGLLPEAALDVVEHARVRRVRLVEDVLEREVRLPEPVTEVLREDPPAVYVVSSRTTHSQRKSDHIRDARGVIGDTHRRRSPPGRRGRRWGPCRRRRRGCWGDSRGETPPSEPGRSSARLEGRSRQEEG